jgi:copper chaperone
MFEFEVNDMTCGHCVGVITKALDQAVPGATVEIDLPAHRVRVSGSVDAQVVENVIRDAGYSPVKKN